MQCAVSCCQDKSQRNAKYEIRAGIIRRNLLHPVCCGSESCDRLKPGRFWRTGNTAENIEGGYGVPHRLLRRTACRWMPLRNAARMAFVVLYQPSIEDHLMGRLNLIKGDFISPIR